MKRTKHYRRIPPDCHAGGLKRTAGFSPVLTYFRTVFSISLVLLSASFCLAVAPPQGVPTRIDTLIDQLASEDAVQRSAAAVDLLKIGRPARPAVLRAARGDDPDLRDRAAQILLQMPWYLPSDPAAIQDILRHYGNPDINQRRQIITGELAAPLTDPAAQRGKRAGDDRAALRDDPAVFDVLARLLAEDPSVDVRWTIAGQFRRMGDADLLSRFRDIQPTENDPPLLALGAYARLETDPDQARKLLARCADLEFANPCDDSEFDYVVDLLCDFDVADKNYAAAADLRRKQYARGSTTDESGIPLPLLELFALQADYGPLPGLDNDLQLAGSAAQTPKIEYSLSLLYAHQSKPKDAAAARAAAFAASHTQTERINVGSFLVDHGWDDLAQPEFNQILQMTPDPDGNQPQIIDARFQLAAMAVRRGDDFEAAKNTELALRAGDGNLTRTDGRGNLIYVSRQDIWAEVHWRCIRAAQAKHDNAEVTKQLNDLLELKATDAQTAMDIAIDAVPLLKQRGQFDAASKLFNTAFTEEKAKLDAHPDDPELLNGIAWLCAETSEHLPEALVWATQAVAKLPQDSAVIDTLADVNYRLGHAQKAVELESRALQLTPGDTFMEAQLTKFRAAAATQPSSPP